MGQAGKKDEKVFFTEAECEGEDLKRCEIIEPAQSVHPADGQNKKAEVRQKRFSIG